VIHKGKGRLIEIGAEVYCVLRESEASIPTADLDKESSIPGERSIKGVIRASGSTTFHGDVYLTSRRWTQNQADCRRTEIRAIGSRLRYRWILLGDILTRLLRG
jgi:hypothetical protein